MSKFLAVNVTYQDGIFEAEDELHRGSLRDGRPVSMHDELHIDKGEDEGEEDDAHVEECRDGRGPLHEVHAVLGQPVKRLEE